MDGNNMPEVKNYIMQLSDYSFLERSVHEIYIWIWFILHVWRCDGFAALRWKRIISFELKSFVTIFILIALPLESFYDIVSTKIKYVEGFYLFPNADHVIRAKPKWLWSEEDQLWFIPSYYLLMAGLGFQTITLFLLQCFWNYLTHSIAKISFMSRGEFTLYIVWGLICIGIFPILPYVFKNNELLLEVIPQLVYATQLLILVLLGIRTHVKFNGLINITASFKNSTNIIAKIRYFIDMNKLLTTSLAITTVSFYLLSIDLLTSAKIINHSKFASDLLIAHANFAAVVEWLALILIFYPRKGFVGTGAGGSSFNTNNGSSTVGPSSSQISHTTNMKLNNVPPGTGTGNNVNIDEKQQRHSSITNINQVNQSNDNYPSAIKSVQLNHDSNNNNVDDTVKESSQKPTIQKQPSFKRFKKKSASPSPYSDSNSDLGNSSDNNEGNSKSVPYLKRNISISKDGKMVYGETKPLGKVKGAEFVAVEKADPSFIPSYYFSNDIKDRNGHVVRIPSLLNDKRSDDDDDDNIVGKGNSGGGGSFQQGITQGVVQQEGGSGGSQQGIIQGMVQQEVIVPQQGTIQENNNAVIGNDDKQDSDGDDEDDDDGYFYAM
ncbi:hypothetical protein C1645_708850 [Glomus cerebriforme]|uniref:Uncharacterized protein n=1 Tax=Glomus cerebriforme TaxID=658196 RepID=A0A397TAT6_9GLOM|nr:hypothetical protein C1645_708850 [Glomus cerebriforme]